VIEYYKEVQVDFESALPLDMGQILSIPFVLIGLVILVRSRNALKTGSKAV
jgi:prolipoprotein diacylglyceryltransferase